MTEQNEQPADQPQASESEEKQPGETSPDPQPADPQEFITTPGQAIDQAFQILNQVTLQINNLTAGMEQMVQERQAIGAALLDLDNRLAALEKAGGSTVGKGLVLPPSLRR